MLVNRAIVRFFEHKEVGYLFHLPGIHTLPLDHALAGSKIKVLTGRHEANVAFMADGFSRATGKAGVVLLTPGPGLGNVFTSCMEAHEDDVPLVFIVIEAERKGAKKGGLHAMEAPEAPFSGIAKAVLVVSEERDLVDRLEAAFRTALTPRRGPVLVFVPYRLLDKDVPYRDGTGDAQKERAAVFDAEPLEKALAGSERPIIVGGAALLDEGIGGQLDALCSESAIPFLTSTGGKGAVREDRGYAFGSVMARGSTKRMLQAADVVIAVGTRLREAETKKRGVKLGRLVHIDVDDRWLARNYRPELALTGDMRGVVESLRLLVRGRTFSWDLEGLKKAQNKEKAELEKERDGFRLVRLLRRHIPDETVTVWDPTLIYYWAELYFSAYHPRSFISAKGISPIFYAFPAAAGAKLGRPKAPCLCVTGDGSFTALAGELATVRAYGIPAVILVYNNGAFGLLEQYMAKRYGVEKTMDLKNPDFVRLAGAFGIKAKRVDGPDDLASIFSRDITWEEPYLIDFRYPPLRAPWD